nr:RNA-dependent RNA polymerase [Picobirnavirus sp.]
MERRYLSLLELDELDPTGKARATISRMVGDSRSPISPLFQGRKRSDYLDQFQSKVFSNMRTERHGSYVAYSDEMTGKFGPQGGSFDLSIVINSFEESYALAEAAKSVDMVLIGVQVLLSAIDYYLNHDCPVPYIPANYVGVTGTASAFPAFTSKGTFDAETVGDYRNWRHLLLDVPGQRHTKCKYRTINQDACSNVRYVEAILHTVRVWLKTYLPQYFSSWLNPNVYLRPMINSSIARRKTNYESDYKAMDNHYSRFIAERVVLPIYERLLLPADYLHLAHYVHEAFEQPIFLGKFIATGLHNLLSGVTITNDFETIYSVCLHLGAMHTCLTEKEIRNTDMAALGDDVFVMLPQSVSEARLQDFKDCVMSEAALNGLEMQEQKCRVATGDLRYCRRVYYESAPRSINPHTGCLEIEGCYPTVLALNSAVNPENVPKSKEHAFVALLQVCDNAHGSPDWSAFVDYIWHMLPDDKQRLAEVIKASPDKFVEDDWWSRLYNERFQLASSLTFKRWLARGFIS